MTTAALAGMLALVTLLALGANPFISAASAAVVGLTWAYMKSGERAP